MRNFINKSRFIHLVLIPKAEFARIFVSQLKSSVKVGTYVNLKTFVTYA